MKQTTDGDFNELTKAVVRGGGISPDERETIAASPFLYARVRARIEAEREGNAWRGMGWLQSVLVASRAIAVLLFVTIGAALAFWFLRSSANVPVPPASAAADNLDRVVAGGTCALSTTEECAVSTEEVLAMLFAEEGRERK